MAETGLGTSEGRARYRREQQCRMAATVLECRRLVPDPASRVLDIGRSRLSAMLLEQYESVTTLGLPLEITAGYAHSEGWDPSPGRHFAGHIVCDLNRVDDASIPAGRFDLIVFAEVVEHLYAAPEAALAWLGQFLKPGGIILCTTPNAAAFTRRVRLLMGHNPAERLRRDLRNPGHVREYVRKDLHDMAKDARLEVAGHSYCDDGIPRPPHRSIVEKSLSALFPSLSRAQMIVYRRPC